MNAFLSFILIASLLFACASTSGSSSANINNTLTKAEEKAGWQLLFDGKSMEHFRGFRKESVPASWQVEDGAIALTGKGGGDIITKNQYENYELSLDWKIAEGGNSGVIYNVSEEPQYAKTYNTGPEMQVLDDERHPDATKGKNGNHRAGSLYDLIPPSTPAVHPAGAWNTARLVVNKGHVEHWLNGKKVVEYQLGEPRMGSNGEREQIRFHAGVRPRQKRPHCPARPRRQSVVPEY